MNLQHRLKWSRSLALWIVVLAVVVPYGLLLLRFSLRNDQIEYFLAVRLYMSDAFRHHEFMLWNPFLSGSYPIHCDMQSSVWNPITVVLAWLFRYNDTLLSLEFLLYYVIGAVGCYYFVRNFSNSYYSCIVMAVAYGCGGFASTISEFMSWVGSFAFLPWAVHFFYLLLKKMSLYSALKLGVALWLLLVCGYPSFLIYLGYGIVGVMLAYCCRLYAGGRGAAVPVLVGLGLLSLLAMVLLSLPAIHSFYEYLPYYARGKRTIDAHINTEYFSRNYPVSLLFPVAGVLVFNNNLYMGLVPALAVAGIVWRRVANWGGGVKKALALFFGLSFRDGVLLAGFVFTLLFTFGRSTPVRIWSAYHLPLMATFGFSHSVGVFLMLILFVWLAPVLDGLFGRVDALPGSEGSRVAGIAGVVVPSRGVDLLRSGDRSVTVMRCIAGIGGLVLGIYLLAGADKSLLKTKLLYFIYYLSGGWQLLLLGVLCFCRWVYRSGRRIFVLVLVDGIISVFVMMPLAGLTVTSPRTYDRSAAAFYREDAGAFLLSPGVGAERGVRRDPHTEVNAMKVTGRNNFPSHTVSQAYYDYVSEQGRYRALLSRPFVFAADSTPLRVSMVELGYNFISVDVEARDSCQGVIQQTYYGRWRVRDERYRFYLAEGGLMGVSLRRGGNRVRLYYYSSDLDLEAGISVVVLLVIAIVLATGERKRRML